MYRIVPLSLSHVDVRTRPHHLYTLGILWGISSTIHFTLITITNTLCTCATLHIALWLSLLGFPLVDENLHNNVTPFFHTCLPYTPNLYDIQNVPKSIFTDKMYRYYSDSNQLHDLPTTLYPQSPLQVWDDRV